MCFDCNTIENWKKMNRKTKGKYIPSIQRYTDDDDRNQFEISFWLFATRKINTYLLSFSFLYCIVLYLMCRDVCCVYNTVSITHTVKYVHAYTSSVYDGWYTTFWMRKKKYLKSILRPMVSIALFMWVCVGLYGGTVIDIDVGRMVGYYDNTNLYTQQFDANFMLYFTHKYKFPINKTIQTPRWWINAAVKNDNLSILC